MYTYEVPRSITNVTQHEKTRLMYPQYMYLLYCMFRILEIYKLHKIPYESCINGVNFIRFL